LSARLALEAEALEERGISDSTLLERALEADPQNSRAKAALSRFERGEPKRSESARLIAALTILTAAAASIAYLLLRRPKPKTTEDAAPAPDAAPPAAVPPPAPGDPATDDPAPELDQDVRSR